MATLYDTVARLAFTFIQIIIIISNTFCAFFSSHTILAKGILLIAAFTETTINIEFILAGIAYKITETAATAGRTS